MTRVLLVEAAPDVRTLMTDLLTEAGYEVIACWNFLDAKAKLGSEPFDLLVSDFLLPGGHLGTELVSCAEMVGIKSLIVTGHPEHVKVLESGKEPYLRKPFRAREFLEQVTLLGSLDSTE